MQRAYFKRHGSLVTARRSLLFPSCLPPPIFPLLSSPSCLSKRRLSMWMFYIFETILIILVESIDWKPKDCKAPTMRESNPPTSILILLYSYVNSVLQSTVELVTANPPSFGVYINILNLELFLMITQRLLLLHRFLMTERLLTLSPTYVMKIFQ